MTSQDSAQHHNTQWTPKLIEVRICLSPKSLDPKNQFFSLISAEEEYVLPSPCFFMTTSKGSDSFRIQVSTTEKIDTAGSKKKRKSTIRKNVFSFHAIASLKDINVACSKLNMANALNSKIVVKLNKHDAVFSIFAFDEATEDCLIKNFDLFDTSNVSRWEKSRFFLKRFIFWVKISILLKKRYSSISF